LKLKKTEKEANVSKFTKKVKAAAMKKKSQNKNKILSCYYLCQNC